MKFSQITATPQKISLISSLVIFGFAMHCVARSIVLPSMKADFNLTFTQSGILFGSSSLAYFFMSSMSAKMSEWLGQRVSLSLYIGLLTLCSFGMALTGSVFLLYFLFILAGACYGGIDTVTTSIVSRYHGDRANIALTRVFSIYCLGGMISALISGYFIYYGVGWRVAYLAIATTCLLVFFVTLNIRDNGTAASPKIELAQLGKLFHNKPFVLSCIATAITSGAETSTINWMTAFFTNGASLNILHSAFYTAMFFLTIFVGRTVMIGFLKRYNAKIIVLLASLISGTLVLMVSFVLSPNTMLFLIVAYALAESCIYPLMLSMTIQYSSENLMYSFIFAMISVSNFVIMGSTGYIADLIGTPGAFRFNAVLYLLTPILFLVISKSKK